MEGFYTNEELNKLGFQRIGENVLISKKSSVYSDGGISLGNDVRIDDFCLLVGNITIGDHVHIGAYCGLHASKGGHIVFQDFSGISSNVHIYASSDCFDGNAITARPGIPDECIDITCREVVLGKYSQIGTGSVVLPYAALGEGVAVGAMSLVTKPLEAWGIYAGIPCRFLKSRSRNMLEKLKVHMEGQE